VASRVRIAGGSHRGRVLLAPPGDATRPTGDRARQALFNILEHGRFAAAGSPLAGAIVLDVFAGTGALGLEALSRGAARAVFFEQAPAALKVLNANIATLGERARAAVIPGDTRRPPPARDGGAGLVFLDPPYGKWLGGEALIALGRAGWIAEQALAVLEIGAGEAAEAPEGYDLLDERRYGAARLLFLRRRIPE
jgi:16S rRNA (guanine966-N2)-methyltransferase